MVHPSSAAAGTVTTYPIYDYVKGGDRAYLDDNIYRDPHGPAEKGRKGPGHTLAVIVLSALIFVTIIAWFNTIQTYFDALIIDDAFYKQVWARIIYSFVVTLIALIVGLVVYLFFL